MLLVGSCFERFFPCLNVYYDSLYSCASVVDDETLVVLTQMMFDADSSFGNSRLTLKCFFLQPKGIMSPVPNCNQCQVFSACLDMLMPNHWSSSYVMPPTHHPTFSTLMDLQGPPRL